MSTAILGIDLDLTLANLKAGGLLSPSLAA